jgi:hypothetical protein
MKKSAKKEPTLNKLARTLGHAAGSIAKVTQELAASASAIVPSGKAKAKQTHTPRRRSKLTKKAGVKPTRRATRRPTTKKKKSR